MAFNFTDEQIRELTGQVLAAPQKIADLNNNKTKAIQLKNDYLDLDNANKVYTDGYLAFVSSYHTELKYLNGEDRTLYDTANIDPAGRLTDGNIHFPSSPVWVNMQPKKHPSNEGLPFGSWVDREDTSINNINTLIDLMKNGFASGATTSSTATAFVGNTVEVNSTAFSNGQTVLFYNGTNFLYGTITSIDSPPPMTGVRTLGISIIYSSAGFGGISIGSTVKNFHSGFNNAQREETVIPPDVAYLHGLKDQIDFLVGLWETILGSEETALNSNDAPETSEIASAIANINTSQSAIDTWQAQPSTGSGVSRFGDTYLNPLISAMSTRLTQITARAAQIISRLGSITQNPDGSYTDSGHYFSFFDNLNLRINKASGTLRNFYQQDLIISVIDQQIATAQAAADRDSATFDIKQFTADANGTNVVSLDNVSGLSISQSVKIMSNAQTTINAVITDIMSLDVELDIIIPSTYKVADKARLVVQN